MQKALSSLYLCMDIPKSRTCNTQTVLRSGKGKKAELGYLSPTSRVKLFFGIVCLAHRQK